METAIILFVYRNAGMPRQHANYYLQNAYCKMLNGPCGFGEQIFIMFSHCKTMGAICCHGNHNFDFFNAGVIPSRF